MTVETWRENYLQGVKEVNEQRKIIGEKVEKKEEKFRLRVKQLERLKADIEKLNNERFIGCNHPSWIDCLVIPIAETFSKELGMEYQTYGPFGMRSQTSIYWKPDFEKTITEKQTYHLSLVPLNLDEGQLGYETGELKEGLSEFQKELSDLNGFNKEVLPLPETLDEIREIIIKSMFLSRE